MGLKGLLKSRLNLCFFNLPNLKYTVSCSSWLSTESCIGLETSRKFFLLGILALPEKFSVHAPSRLFHVGFLVVKTMF